MDELNYLLDTKDRKLQNNHEAIASKDKMIEYYCKQQENYKNEADVNKRKCEELMKKNNELLEELEKIKKSNFVFENFSNKIHFLENEQLQSPKKRKEYETFDLTPKKRKL